MRYQRSLRNHIHNKYRVDFLHSCLRNDLTPRFLKFRIPSDGCFEPTIVHNFHRKLSKKEISTTSARVLEVKEELDNARKEFLQYTSEATLPSKKFHTRKYMRELVSEIKDRHRRKLESLFSEQEKPLHDLKNTVRIVGDIKVPDLVLDYLSLGPKHPVRDKFNDLHFLADVDRFKLLKNLDKERINTKFPWLFVYFM